MSKLTIRCKRPLAFLLTLLLTVMIFPVAGPADSVSACHLVRIEIYPGETTILAGESIPYTAEAFDNYGDSMGFVTPDTTFSIEYLAGGYWSPHNTYFSENAGTWVVTGEYEGKIDTATLMVQPKTDLSIVKLDSPDPVIAGEDLTYTITVTNNGPSDASGVVVTDTLLAGVTFKSATGGATHDSGIVTWNAGSLAGGASATLTIIVTVDTEMTQETIANTATVDGCLLYTSPSPRDRS